jgi:hypothetical protein
MILLPFKISRRKREFIHRVTGAVALFVWLFMATAEICTPLHAWLHGGSIPDDDDCPVVAIATGHVHVAVVQVQAPAPGLLTEITPRVEVAIFVPRQKILPNDRAPPVSCA